MFLKTLYKSKCDHLDNIIDNLINFEHFHYIIFKYGSTEQ